ncbi:DMT family transporter [Solemya velum gill symbiont]|uniref:Permease n=1 Tax=Solemya velum gill symbiont TaxID=2340 RepID=A0A0B0H9T3_SOVGS|nr:DMT family transporter [Solemya velum gill symbiont]KHF25835.1 permease [Solemya velum gill symbiont]OOY34536.1 hypothetical protein BOV88_09535 [Solemya velum gill symbiont]OOY37251.1 hypothetical protein BOV89_08375 [Solemya velum gill symbiont]OOY39755.1 hypothetical protein BOV90_07620 [Solemya velum gill symbiont]OOY47570.1 hypothetical protein BOV93_06220 [Solemya velum gill symbiont]
MFTTYLKLVFAVVSWGGAFVFAKMAGADIGEVEAASWRFLVSALLLTPLLFRTRFPKPTAREMLLFLVLGLSGIYFYNLFFFHGLQLIKSSLAGMIIALNPIVILLLSVYFFKERLTPKMFAGVVISITGAIVVVLGRQVPQGGEASSWLGIILILGCVISWSIYSLFGKAMMKRYSPGQLISVSVWIGAVILLLHLYLSGSSLPPVSGISLFSVFYLSAIATVLAFVWYYDAIRQIGAGFSAQFINLVPFSAALFGYFILDERISLLTLSGGVLVVTGVLITQRAKISQAEASAPCSPKQSQAADE